MISWRLFSQPHVHFGSNSITGVLAGDLKWVALLQGISDAELEKPSWDLTQDAMGGVNGDAVAQPWQSLYWGGGRVVSLEQPGRWGAVVDMPAHAAAEDWAALTKQILSQVEEDQIAIRGGNTLVRRLVRTRALPIHHDWLQDRTILITGGTGALGAHSARWLAKQGCKHLVLTSRRGLEAQGAKELQAELEVMGAKVTIASCDVADKFNRDELTTLSVPRFDDLTDTSFAN
mgnify:CR=1 FL=1